MGAFLLTPFWSQTDSIFYIIPLLALMEDLASLAFLFLHRHWIYDQWILIPFQKLLSLYAAHDLVLQWCLTNKNENALLVPSVRLDSKIHDEISLLENTENLLRISKTESLESSLLLSQATLLQVLSIEILQLINERWLF